MLTEIKKGTRVPTLEQVVAINEQEKFIVGYLTYLPKENLWVCNSEKDILANITHFITIETLLKSK